MFIKLLRCPNSSWKILLTNWWLQKDIKWVCFPWRTYSIQRTKGKSQVGHFTVSKANLMCNFTALIWHHPVLFITLIAIWFPWYYSNISSQITACRELHFLRMMGIDDNTDFGFCTNPLFILEKIETNFISFISIEIYCYILIKWKIYKINIK